MDICIGGKDARSLAILSNACTVAKKRKETWDMVPH
jgi:hypothetical protein